jgi:CBS domain-containing protein
MIMMNEPLSSIMATELVTLHADDTLDNVRQVFVKNRIHHIPIVNDEFELVGIISTYDLFKIDKDREEFGEIRVGDVMTTGIATLEPEDKVGAAAEVFLEHLFHAVPIVKDKKLLGIVTSHDILRYEFRKEYPNDPVARI